MKSLLASVFFVTCASAYAGSPEQAYIGARDAAIARLDKLVDAGTAGDSFAKPHEAAEKDLTQMLIGIVGPVSVKGFSTAAKLNLGSLVTGDQGFGTLDGLTFATPDDKGSLLVTTEPLYKLWISEHTSGWADEVLAEPPQAIETLLHMRGFYATALTSDAALYKLAELPISRPATATAAAALLTARSQDQTPDHPGSLVVGLIFGKRLMIAEVPLKAPIPAVAACTRIQTAAEPKINAANEAFIATERKNATLGLQLHKLEIETAKAFETCFIDKSKTQKGYQAAIAQAEALIATMTSR